MTHTQIKCKQKSRIKTGIFNDWCNSSSGLYRFEYVLSDFQVTIVVVGTAAASLAAPPESRIKMTRNKADNPGEKKEVFNVENSRPSLDASNPLLPRPQFIELGPWIYS